MILLIIFYEVICSIRIILKKCSRVGGRVTGSTRNKANSAFSLVELGLGLSLAINFHGRVAGSSEKKSRS